MAKITKTYWGIACENDAVSGMVRFESFGEGFLAFLAFMGEYGEPDKARFNHGTCPLVFDSEADARLACIGDSSERPVKLRVTIEEA